MTRFLVPGLVLLTVAFALAPASASALSCNRRLVTQGDPAHYVRSICGEPDAAYTRTESRTQYSGYPSYAGIVLGSSYSVTVQVDTWVYDFGPHRFMEELTFENGILRSSRALGYGTNVGRSRAVLHAPELPRERFAVRRERWERLLAA